jgi:ABC-2 type transport system permease protein
VNLVGLWTLCRRELRRTFRIINQVVWPPLIATVLFLTVFVIGLGRAVGEMEGLPYVAFLLPGLMFMQIVETSFGESAASLFILRFTGSIQELLVAPLSRLEMVLGLLSGTILRALLIAGLVLGVGLFVGAPYGASAPVHPLGLVGLVILLAVCFASLGLLMGLAAESFDQMSIPQTFLVTPLVYTAGVFLSVHQAGLPAPLALISRFNPMTPMVDMLRWAVTGHAALPVGQGFAIVGGLATCALLGVTAVFRSGWKLQH